MAAIDTFIRPPPSFCAEHTASVRTLEFRHEDYRPAGSQYPKAELQAAAARLRRALPRVRPRGEVPLRAGCAVLAARRRLRVFTEVAFKTGDRARRDRARELPWR